jgi:p-hydroxybenzoate 3-monooxygenase
MHTPVTIIGAGPAGLFLFHFLHRAGIECVLEARSRAHLESWVRLSRARSRHQILGLDDRLKLNGMVDSGLNIRFRGQIIHLDLPGLTGKCAMIYGQQEVVKDLIAARLAAG